ncbi:ankyrin repeat and protein kinase domain-containing protein 1-like [Selaginella moellendorffii]|nr:ankyrin repeat and protein kinase domain-containing protein 1-like [Selaginella moellendorffii]|eukprot:XP_024520504.1 ankyrin repeat and protein kinase domain-containing protein 1-like [Selaginella moellendorffii]
MDRLLVIDPKELVFDFEIGQRCSSFVILKNVMFTMPVAFKITASSNAGMANSKKYTMKPSQGIISPAGRATVEIILNPQQSLPDEFPNSLDKFVVKSLVVPGGNQHNSVSNEWFESKKNFVYADAGLKAFFKGSAIVSALVASPDSTMEDVREVLERGVDLNKPGSSGPDRSPLHVAIASGRPEMVQLLLEFGANVEVRDRFGKTPMHEAAAAGQTLAMELLLANGANTEARTESVGWTALHFATYAHHLDAVRILLAKGADVNSTAGPEERTALHIATAGGAQRCLKQLLERGANPNAVTATGQTALHIAAGQADVAASRLLIQHGAWRNVRDLNGHIPFDAAVEAGADKSLLDLLKLGDDLRRAARRGDLKSVRVCLKQGADPNGRDENGWTALHCAAFKGSLEVVRLLIDRNVDVNCEDCEGYSPLHCAVEMGHSEIVQVLMRRGADVNAKIKKGCCAVKIGSLMGEDGIVGLLLDGGARDARSLVSSVSTINLGKIRGSDDSSLKKKKNGERFPRSRTLSCEAY